MLPEDVMLLELLSQKDVVVRKICEEKGIECPQDFQTYLCTPVFDDDDNVVEWCDAVYHLPSSDGDGDSHDVCVFVATNVDDVRSVLKRFKACERNNVVINDENLYFDYMCLYVDGSVINSIELDNARKILSNEGIILLTRSQARY